MWGEILGSTVMLGAALWLARYRRATVRRSQELELSKPPRRTCLTPWVAKQAKNPDFSIQSIYAQLDGGQIVVEQFLYDKSRSVTAIGADGDLIAHRKRARTNKNL